MGIAWICWGSSQLAGYWSFGCMCWVRGLVGFSRGWFRAAITYCSQMKDLLCGYFSLKCRFGIKALIGYWTSFDAVQQLVDLLLHIPNRIRVVPFWHVECSIDITTFCCWQWIQDTRIGYTKEFGESAHTFDPLWYWTGVAFILPSIDISNSEMKLGS